MALTILGCFGTELITHGYAPVGLHRTIQNYYMKAQRIQLAQALIRLAPDVTPKDRQECAKKLNVSKVTICYYLAGKVAKSDKGIEMLEFFKSRIETRQKEIKNLCQ